MIKIIRNIKQSLIAIIALGLGVTAAAAANPAWLEADSAAAIDRRTRADFALSFKDGVKQIKRLHPEVTDADIERFVRHGYIEVRTIDGQRRMHVKSPRNLGLVNPDMNGGYTGRTSLASAARLAGLDTILATIDGRTADGAARRFRYRYSVDVPCDPALAGDTLRLWLPMPRPSQRQSDIRIVESHPQVLSVSDPDASVHRSIYMEQPVAADGTPTHFDVTIEYTASAEYHDPEQILAALKPYDTGSELYRRYTAMEAPHIVRLDSLARAIVGGETNPLRQSELVYDYIYRTFPWAGAREYSTIPCIPEYVLAEGHGDCGQVSLLYISLMRSLGVPARWESGWMMHPGEENYHDWAEVYFEGVGWVPVDVSFGRFDNATDPRARRFYSTGIDAYRLAANSGVCGPLVPAKRFVRSETVDQQAGELETSHGNIFYPGFRRRMEVLSATPVERPADKAARIVADVKRRLAPDRRQVIADIAARQGADGRVLLSGATSEGAVMAAVRSALDSASVSYTDSVRVYPDSVWALPRISVACMRVRPAHAGEMASQALMGMPLRVLDHVGGEWYLVQTPDGYIAYTNSPSIVLLSDAEMREWREADRLVVTAPYQLRVYTSPKASGVRDVVSDLVAGNIVRGSLKHIRNGRVEVTLPDGRSGWADAKAFTEIGAWASQPFDSDVILDMAYSMEGTPYLWGGTSAKTLDCSGLAKTSYLANGLILMRDASQQALTGERIEAADWRNCRAADLLFFGNAKTGKVTHVAIYDADGRYVHSSGRVKRNSVDPASPDYLTTPFLHAVRIHGHEGTSGITRAAEHPWYFNL